MASTHPALSDFPGISPSYIKWPGEWTHTAVELPNGYDSAGASDDLEINEAGEILVPAELVQADMVLDINLLPLIS